MRLLGLDFGEKRIGVAVSDPLGFTAQAVAVIGRKNLAEDIKEIKKLLDKYEATEIVIGLPRTLKGEIGEEAKKVLEFAQVLEKDLKLSVITWDERLTTAAAEKVLIEADLSRQKRKKVIDKLAAVYILQSYLDHKKHKS